MARTTKAALEDAELAAALEGLDGWRAEHGGKAIAKTFVFDSFGEAFAFMTRAALQAEARNHHPSWRQDMGRVAVTLSTHDAGGVTLLDVKLAQFMDAIVQGATARGPGGEEK